MIKVPMKKIPFLLLSLILSIIVIYLLIPKNIGDDNPLNGNRIKCFGYEFKKKSDFWEDTIKDEVYDYYCVGVSYDSIGNECFKIGAACLMYTK